MTADNNQSFAGGNSQTSGNTGMSNPISTPTNSFASNTKAAMSYHKDNMGTFGKNDSQSNNSIQNTTTGSTFATDNKKVKEKEEAAAA